LRKCAKYGSFRGKIGEARAGNRRASLRSGVSVLLLHADVSELAERLGHYASRQLPFAMSRALNDTGDAVAKRLNDETLVAFDRPTPFTQRAFAVLKRSDKQTAAVVVGARPIQEEYLRLQVTGGTRIPKGKALLVPRRAELNAYGNLPRSALRRLLARKDVFVARRRDPRTRHLEPGLYQRWDGRLIPLIAFEDQAQYERRFRFEEVAKAEAIARLPDALATRLAEAISTAR
jgi:hypothetical protein